MDYGRYLAGRGQPPPGVLAGGMGAPTGATQSHRILRSQHENHRRARTVLSNPECMTLRELKAPPQRALNSQVVIENPIIEEREPFLR